jgi:hypothetical protein
MAEQTISGRAIPAPTEQKEHEKGEYKLFRQPNKMGGTLLKLFMGLILYMLIITSINYSKIGLLTPRELLINPFVNLLNALALFVLIVCEVFVWVFLEPTE